MPRYVLESYGAGHEDSLADGRARATRAAVLGLEVRYLRTTFLPEEQTLLHVFDAASPDLLEQAARRAELSYERIVEAVEESPGGAER